MNKPWSKRAKHKSTFEKPCNDCGVVIRFVYSGKIKKFLPPVEVATGNQHFCAKYEAHQVAVKAEMHDLATGAKVGAVVEQYASDVESLGGRVATLTRELQSVTDEVALLRNVVSEQRRLLDALNNALHELEKEREVAPL